MQQILLTRGFVAIVDDDMADELWEHLWYASGVEGRPARRLKEEPRRLILMYHQILRVKPWELRLQGLVVDHINGDPLDNRLENLRIVTHAENARNADRHRFREGIGYDSTHDRYKAYIDMPNQPRVNIGTYKTRSDAETALANAKREMGLANN
jgi:hypothetical protein